MTNSTPRLFRSAGGDVGMSKEQLTRRSFVKFAGVSGMAVIAAGALSGCGAWTPRSQAADGEVPVNQSSSEMVEVADDLILIEGGAFMMGSPEEERAGVEAMKGSMR